MNKVFILTILVFSVFLSGCSILSVEDLQKEEEILLPSEPQFEIKDCQVEDGDTFATILEDYGIGYADMLEILDSSSSTYDFTSIRLGQPLRFAYDDLGQLKYFEYEKDKEEIVHVSLENGEYKSEKIDIEYEIKTNKLSGTIEESLWLAGLDAGLTEELILEFADIFAWTVDFSVEVRKGDSFKVLFEERYRDGEYVGINKVLAGSFTNAGEEFKAYLFENDEGKLVYYNEAGEAMIKQFLKAPLKYKYISSGFTYARFHPVTQNTGPHRAIDYAASAGTPIMAVGNGTVTFAGWKTGYGNYIDIHHNDVYETQYAHLSAYAKGIRYGSKVVQGQVIGYVGSTGWSTGPHLHYQIRKHGTLVNPAQVDLPPGDPVREEKKAEFEMVMRGLDQRLN
ncbi:MAG: peptidoglycan DD-metalloendopeptidase family protein [Candidatus Magasanikbacteria bacterium]|jgi:murein DD-endopeptidase MepM/ murein hydrolase activator NlpD|nr:peptidoglycan DD-metalloendopeptidase family protein [Candidatus Magasanikbacteria bacterium]MBT4315014.1 peptidoglycan DD-metalloendopeptidase family protein [Candidatus Magasanikbacteria bacterium]MBT4546793.1 peptidoglycan DD-metalloendopeptidase family protein [Candidatus Magasanikbacteria bacterium]MBT6818958.1 peptidoglycan DD-metalloendopeptidase family protein [Candidatus Magasanikbacteria bacterium]